MTTKSSLPFYRTLGFQMLVAVVLGVLVGFAWPNLGTAFNPLASGFIRLIRMVIALIIFLIVSTGIARVGDVKTVGRLGIKLLIYFEVVSTLALILGMVMSVVFQPGAGMNIDLAHVSASATAGYASTAKSLSVVDFILNIIPNTAVGAFAEGSILQVLLFSIFVGFALLFMGKRAEPLVEFLQQWTEVVFIIVRAIIKVAPLAVFGAAAYVIGKFGLGSLLSLGKLIILVYVSCILFIAVVMGTVAAITGFNLWKFIKYLREEMILAFFTASSEAVLPFMFAKLKNVGCSDAVVGFAIPTGYSFNLDGSSLYLTAAAMFIAQAANVHLSFAQEISLMAIFLLSSKGVAGVPAGGFVVLAGTLSIFPDIPMAGLALLLGIDRFLDAMRTMTNVLGNGVATMAIARWEGQRDDVRMHAVLNGEHLDIDAVDLAQEV
jgi:aerobic C4-dicarboxylate transport protein